MMETGTQPVFLFLYYLSWSAAGGVAYPLVTVGRRDAAVERTGMYSQRVTSGYATPPAALQDTNQSWDFKVSAIHTSLEQFQRDVIEASQQRPLLVDFWADWCSPCLVIAPVLEQVIAALDGAVGLIKLEVDDGENMKLAGHYRVRGFPTIMLFMDGEEVARFSGARSRSQVMEFLHQHEALPHHQPHKKQ